MNHTCANAMTILDKIHSLLFLAPDDALSLQNKLKNERSNYELPRE